MIVTTLGNISNKVRLVIYGPPGAGKTTWAADAPKPVWLDFENSSEALRKNFPNTPIITRDKLKDAESVIQWITKPNEYETIVVDTISSMNETWLLEYMKNKKGAKIQDVASQPDFRVLNHQMKRFFYALIECDKHVVLIAHEKVWRDDKSDTPRVLEVRPALPPGAEASVARLVNEVFYLTSKSQINGPDKRVLHVSGQGKILAKNRQGLEVSTIENPTWKEVYK
jgi:phage nucleotide-binding protein